MTDSRYTHEAGKQEGMKQSQKLKHWTQENLPQAAARSRRPQAFHFLKQNVRASVRLFILRSIYYRCASYHLTLKTLLSPLLSCVGRRIFPFGLPSSRQISCRARTKTMSRIKFKRGNAAAKVKVIWSPGSKRLSRPVWHWVPRVPLKLGFQKRELI